jgi:hypothetical protein
MDRRLNRQRMYRIGSKGGKGRRRRILNHAQFFHKEAEL